MEKQITTGWTWYWSGNLLTGFFLIVQTSQVGEFAGILIGSWLSLMGSLALVVLPEIVLDKAAVIPEAVVSISVN